jgi:hypothetical protein
MQRWLWRAASSSRSELRSDDRPQKEGPKACLAIPGCISDRGPQKIPEALTLNWLGNLMDYHDPIKDTPNSALNFRASLDFLNSLLLPILAFVAANLKEVITLLNPY